MTDEPAPKPSRSSPFSTMANTIEHNADSAFGGAFVIVPPEGGATLQTLILDASEDPHMQFWVLLSQKCKDEIDRLDNSRRQGHLRR